MLPNRPLPPTRARRRGLVAAEMLLVLPIFLLLLTGMIGFADLLIAEQKMDEASGRAARVAALGGSEEQIEEAVRAVLGPDRAKHATIHITPICGHDANRTGDEDHEDQKDSADHDDGEGDGKSRESGRAPPRGRHLGLIEVRVELEVRYATATRFVPTARTEKLIGRTVVQRQ